MSQTNQQKALKKILKSSLNGKLDEEKQNAIDLWYNQLGAETLPILPLENPEQQAQLERSIKNGLNQKALSKLEKRSAKIQLNYIKYAAIFFFCLILGIQGYHFFNTDKRLAKAVTYSSNRTAAKLVTLKDGSKVLLNVSSQITIDKDFGVKDRRITLTGEAFFDIAKDKRKPFVIHTGKIDTKVLGTSFNINAYPDRDKIKIGVITGKVSVLDRKSAKQLAYKMTSGTTLSYYIKNSKTVLRDEDLSLISAWKDNRLFIDNATIVEIRSQLERYYHVKVVLHNKVHNGKRYTIHFDKDPANRVMQILSMLTKRKFIYQTNQIIIK